MADRRTPEPFGSAPVKRFRLFCALSAALFMAFFPPPFLAGQESPPEPGGSFYIEQTGEELRFIQRLVWEKAEYAYRYEIVIETEDDSGEYAEIRREFRTENFIDLSLAPGSYRYRIQVYNLLNRPAGLSGWIPFRVLPALQPELYSFSQEFLPAGDPRGGMEIVLYGRNLVEGAELRLDPADGAAVAPPAYLPAGESARLVFNREPPAPGLYRVYIRNPGGLETSLDITLVPPPAADSGDASAAPDSAAADSGDVSAAPDSGADDSSAVPAPDSELIPRRLFGLYAAAEYVPLFPLYGHLFDRLGRSFYPIGVSARIAFMFLKPSWGDLGLELAPSWHMLDAGAVTVHMYPLHLNGIYQFWLPGQKTALVFRLGGGITLLQGINGQSSGSVFTWMPSAAGEAVFRWYPAANARRDGHNAFYVEAGAGYAHVFSADSPQPGYIRPVLGAGWRF